MRGYRPPGITAPDGSAVFPVAAPHATALCAGAHSVIAGATARLGSAIDAAARRANTLGHPVLAWATEEIPPLDPLDAWDRSVLMTGDRVLWARPSDGFALVGIGTAWTITPEGPDRFGRADSAWQALLRDGVTLDAGEASIAVAPLATMGFAFGSRHPMSPEWTGYPAAVLSVPRVTFTSAGRVGRIILAAVADPARDRHPDDEVQACLDACAAVLGGGHPAADAATEAGERAAVGQFPAAEAWKDSVRAAARAIRAGHLQKVVLSRGIRVRGHRFDPGRVLRRLRNDYRECTLFAATRGPRCFLGATPERLVRLRGGWVTVAAIAGSAPRGRTEEEDRRLGEALRTSEKDRIEHAIVVDALRHALRAVCTALPPGAPPQLLKVRNVQHLHTPLAAYLRDRRTLLDLIDLLHPTPAVGGVPRDASLRWIGEHEGWDRGWYGAPIGWMDAAGEGECAVAIRSALLHDTEALLFAGCGIVADSDPDTEYAESSLKLEAVLSALTGERMHGDG
jgi:isochorismate synthase